MAKAKSTIAVEVAAPVVHLRTATSNHIHFDLFEYTRDLSNVDVASQIAQGSAWRLDTMIQQASRLLFKNVREDLYKKGVDGISELSIALRESKFAAESFRDAGSHTTGPVDQINELMHFRERAHETARELTSLCNDWQGRPLTYETPDLDDVFHAEVNMKIKPLTRRRLAMSTERHAKEYNLSPEEVQSMISKKISRKEADLKDAGVTLQDQAGAVYELFRIACVAGLDASADTFNFHQMDIAAQRTLLDAAITNAQRAEDRAADNRNLTDSEYDDICMTVLKVTKELKAVMQSPRFVIAERVAEAG